MTYYEQWTTMMSERAAVLFLKICLFIKSEKEAMIHTAFTF